MNLLIINELTNALIQINYELINSHLIIIHTYCDYYCPHIKVIELELGDI